MNLSHYEHTLLEGWEEVHKKSQLTLWILLSIKNGPKHMSDIKATISDMTNGTIRADDKSMYRALRRFHDADIVSFSTERSEAGPDKKIYALTTIGENVLNSFVQRNITSVFIRGENRHLFT